MPRWTIQVDEETDRTIRTHLARNGGKKGDLSRFVTEATRQAALWGTVDAVREHNEGVPQEEIEAAVDQAVAETRAVRDDASRP